MGEEEEAVRMSREAKRLVVNGAFCSRDSANVSTVAVEKGSRPASLITWSLIWNFSPFSVLMSHELATPPGTGNASHTWHGNVV